MRRWGSWTSANAFSSLGSRHIVVLLRWWARVREVRASGGSTGLPRLGKVGTDAASDQGEALSDVERAHAGVRRVLARRLVALEAGQETQRRHAAACSRRRALRAA